jgi:hypothetical protein
MSMSLVRLLSLSPLAIAVVLLAAPAPARAEVKPAPTGGFVIEHRLTLPGSPERIYDAITGDLTGWWDHTFSGKPKAFYVEPWPGGGFYEIFDDSGDGVRHGTVIWAQRGKRLRVDGPLGLSGNALQFVFTYDLAARGDSTDLVFQGSGAGRVDDGWPALIDGVWHHFLFDGLKPYVESGRDRDKKPWPRPASAAGRG